MKTPTRRAAATVAALIAAGLGLSGCGFSGLYSANLPGGPNVGNHSYTVSIDFADVLDLVPQSNVKVNDVAVGKVVSVSLVDWHARVKVRVNGNVRLPENARAAVKQTSLLGEKYVDLEQPLDNPAPTDLKSGDLIPLTRTGTAPEVEEVLGALSLVLNGGGLQQIQTITDELNKALKGNEGAIRDLLGQLNTFVGGLDKQKTVITHALDQLDTLTTTLNRQKKSITDALDTFPQALDVLNRNRSQLTSLLQSLSRLGTTATGVINATQQDFVSSLQSLSPVLEQLTAAGDNFPKALKQMLTFPFPVGKTTDFVKGDYANLSLHLDVELNTNLCGLNIPGLCDLINGLLPAGTPGKKPATTTSGTATNAATSTPIVLPGMGG
ncbi:MAG: phospholipid/cholesterol/gamma-HCH transport system substrate-binding protein [Pseudonocardiales bacterium]|nr:phospholipid/cholesterol/gamma-HCH transport system substrate-binding protein [Pseudonocardiales bacterium]